MVTKNQNDEVFLSSIDLTEYVEDKNILKYHEEYDLVNKWRKSR